MPNEKSLNPLVLMDKQGLARNIAKLKGLTPVNKQELARKIANITGLAKTGECDVCHDEFPLGELFPYDGKDLCESCLKEAEEPMNLCPVCSKEIPETSRFCGEDCESAFYREKSKV